MKHFFITLVFLFTINSFSQESLAWVDYEVMIDSKDVPVVLSLLDNHFSNSKNRAPGIEYNFTEFTFKDSGLEATHLFQLVGDVDAINAANKRVPDADFFLLIEKINALSDSYSSLFGKDIFSYGTSNTKKMEQIYSLKINDVTKFLPAFSTLVKKVKPENFISFGSVISGASDGQTHYIYTEQNDLKSIINPKNGPEEMPKAWSTFYQNAGDFEVIRSFTRNKLKSWK
jgi:hypothetical protein